jgi:hypothetical protein
MTLNDLSAIAQTLGVVAMTVHRTPAFSAFIDSLLPAERRA